eukprot:gnl/MRDRNA2_/MRDRNA2_85357_c0_seq1.p2 gnl/MRDRNA2_/MRDRNA2_85357_c0~~gnl/MRDRNA2_/MRDRNA2_85357_c0_seq1.p2  ORF type:complete len:132 (+),score=27.03 gnl/MRDRNA2_/MRDRNA2_85357_c0_seq1:129-524(+)
MDVQVLCAPETGGVILLIHRLVITNASRNVESPAGLENCPNITLAPDCVALSEYLQETQPEVLSQVRDSLAIDLEVAPASQAKKEVDHDGMDILLAPCRADWGSWLTVGHVLDLLIAFAYHRGVQQGTAQQ